MLTPIFRRERRSAAGTGPPAARREILLARLDGKVRGVLAQRRGEIDQVLLLLPEDLANVLGDRVLAERFTLFHALAIRADRVALVLEVGPQHRFGLLGLLHWL